MPFSSGFHLTKLIHKTRRDICHRGSLRNNISYNAMCGLSHSIITNFAYIPTWHKHNFFSSIYQVIPNDALAFCYLEQCFLLQIERFYEMVITFMTMQVKFRPHIIYTTHKAFMNGFACSGFDLYGAIISTGPWQKTLVYKSAKKVLP